jgi:hypothetical protein
LNTIVTEALVTPACPLSRQPTYSPQQYTYRLYIRSIKLFARTEVMLVIPSTKQIASRIFDFPEPFNPVIALKDSSNPGIISFLAMESALKLASDSCSDWVRLKAYQISFSSDVVILGTHRPESTLQSSSWQSLSCRFSVFLQRFRCFAFAFSLSDA